MKENTITRVLDILRSVRFGFNSYQKHKNTPVRIDVWRFKNAIRFQLVGPPDLVESMWDWYVKVFRPPVENLEEWSGPDPRDPGLH